jgi:hypothetical protein
VDFKPFGASQRATLNVEWKKRVKLWIKFKRNPNSINLQSIGE